MMAAPILSRNTGKGYDLIFDRSINYYLMCSSGYSSMEQRKLVSQTEREGGEYEI